jgi:hypothetical protein
MSSSKTINSCDRVTFPNLSAYLELELGRLEGPCNKMFSAEIGEHIFLDMLLYILKVYPRHSGFKQELLGVADADFSGGLALRKMPLTY